MVVDDVTGNGQGALHDDGANLTLRITKIGGIPFADGLLLTRTEPTPLPCTRINVALFRGEEKVKVANQQVGDASFGQMDFSLSEGTYRLVMVAHSGAGNATITTPERISFKDNKVTDTYYHYRELTIGQPQQLDIELTHNVAMVRMVLQEDLPTEATQCQFKYTGGSSTLDATTGLGCVQSRQTETRSVAADHGQAPYTFELFTFPHEPSDLLRIHMNIMDEAGSTLCERTFDVVPIGTNQITEYAGRLLSSEEGDATFTIKTHDEWITSNH